LEYNNNISILKNSYLKSSYQNNFIYFLSVHSIHSHIFTWCVCMGGGFIEIPAPFRRRWRPDPEIMPTIRNTL